MGSSETKRDAPDIYQGDDIVRSYIERYKVLSRKSLAAPSALTVGP